MSVLSVDLRAVITAAKSRKKSSKERFVEALWQACQDWLDTEQPHPLDCEIEAAQFNEDGVLRVSVRGFVDLNARLFLRNIGLADLARQAGIDLSKSAPSSGKCAKRS